MKQIVDVGDRHNTVACALQRLNERGVPRLSRLKTQQRRHERERVLDAVVDFDQQGLRGFGLARQPHLGHDLLGKQRQEPLLRGAQRARTVIQDAQRPKRQAVFCLDESARVEAKMRIALAQRIVACPRIDQRVGDDRQARLQDRVGADR